MKCLQCEFDNPDGTRFCGNCGNSLQSEKGAKVTTRDTETLGFPVQQLTRGTTFARRYEIIEELGKGGMGNVYRVEDTKIDEEIALKLIRPEIAADQDAIERFSNELKMARKISHRNVARMHDLDSSEGMYYITMEYIAGEDLKSFVRRAAPLSTARSIAIAKQVCEGLKEAHRLGVVHRDLKPSNIMIDKEGNARIMDFGIARSLKAKGFADDHVMIGTPEYMSPEQVEGKEIDHRSDIYSLGIILYEMVTGRVPFKEETPLNTAIKQKLEKPINPIEINSQTHEDLSRVILKCLEKNKKNRYQSTSEVFSELTKIEKNIRSKKPVLPLSLKKTLIPVLAVIAAAIVAIVIWKLIPPRKAAYISSGKPSIAVLPFADLSPQRDQEYFCDGMTEEIIAKLSRLQGWKVMSKSSVMRYKEAERDVKSIGRDLNVQSILEGSIRKENDDIRITTRLINVEDGFHLWVETYNRKLDRVFAIQNDIAENIVNALKQELSPEEKERLQKKTTENLEAYNLYLLGRYFWNMRTDEGMRKSIEYFQQALEKDPNYALAYTGLADCYIAGGGKYFDLAAEQAYPRARAAAMRALEVDETLAEAHTSLAGLLTSYYWDWEAAEKEFRRAIELNPNYATAYQWYAEHLWSIGRHDEAISHARRALELDPLSMMINTVLGVALYFGGMYDQAIEQYKSTLLITRDFPRAHSWLGFSYVEKAMYVEAIVHFKEAVNLSNSSPEDLAALAYGYAVAGRRSEAENILQRLQSLSDKIYVSPLDFGMIYVSLDNKEEAFEWLEKAYEEHADRLAYIKVNPVFNPLRSDSRFQNLLDRMNFPE